MRKKLLLLLSLFIFLSFANLNVYANKTQPITVKLNDQVLKFDTEPIIENGRTMVPMRAIFEQLGSRVYWYDEIKTVTGYRPYKNISDMFIKLKIGDNVMYQNGKSVTLDSPPIIRDSRTLVPVRFIAQSFGIKVDWDEENRTVLLSYDTDEFQGTKLIDDISYKLIFFEDALRIRIPEYWRESEDSNKFGHKDEENSIQMVVDITQLEESKTLEEFTEENKSSILDEYKDNVLFTGSDKINVNNIDINVVYLKISSLTPEINQVIYYFTSSDYGYKITFSYSSESNDSQLLNIISNIINTIEISGVTFDTDREHYIEYKAFFNYGINLSSEIHSSMDVENEFSFTGTISENKDLDHFVVVISDSDSDSSTEFKIPISDYKFDSKIYTPFGLGKHNITIKTPESQDSPSQEIMQFSVINTSTENIKYLIPSVFVEKDDSEIISMANEITQNVDKEYFGEYDKAKVIFEWVFENIEYDLDGASDTSRSSKDVLRDKKGNNEEISYLYAALLRASNIPSKIVKGSIKETTEDGVKEIYHVWNEIMINNKWIIVDVIWGSGYMDSENMAKNLDMSYFNGKRSIYEDKFPDITTLGY